MNKEYFELKDLNNQLQFNLERNEFGSARKNLSQILQIISKEKWFISKIELKQIKESINIINNKEQNNKKEENAINQEIEKIKYEIKNSSLTKKIKNNIDKKYGVKILKENNIKLTKKEKNKIKDAYNLIDLKINNAEKDFTTQVKKLISKNNEYDKISKRILKLASLLNTDSKEISECLKQYNKTKDNNYLKRRLLKYKKSTVYYPIEYIKDNEEKIVLNKNISIISMKKAREIFKKTKNYDDFINFFEGKLKSNLGFLEISASDITYKNLNKKISNYYELSLDIISFLENKLRYNIEYSDKQLHQIYIFENRFSIGLSTETSILRRLEISKELKDNFKFFNFLFNDNLKPISLRIRNAIKYIRKGNVSLFNEDKLLNYVISMETLLLDYEDWSKSSNSKDKITISKIKKLISYLPEYQELPEIYSKIYSKRHKIVHNGGYNIKISKDEIRYLKNTSFRIISQFLNKRKFKKLSNLINSIEDAKADYFNKELNRIKKFEELNKEFVLDGKLYKNKEYLGNFKSKIKIEVHEKIKVIDIILSDFENKSIKINGVNGNDLFYVEGNFHNSLIEKTETNFSALSIYEIINKNMPSFFTSSGQDILRLKYSDKIKSKEDNQNDTTN